MVGVTLRLNEDSNEFWNNFEGYKLDPHKLEVTCHSLKATPFSVRLNDSNYDFLHLKLICQYNSLYTRRIQSDLRVYFFDASGNLIEMMNPTRKSWTFNSVVVPDNFTECTSTQNDVLPPSLRFLNQKQCLISNGKGTLSLYSTNFSLHQFTKWQLCGILMQNQPDLCYPFIISDAWESQHVTHSELFCSVIGISKSINDHSVSHEKATEDMSNDSHHANKCKTSSENRKSVCVLKSLRFLHEYSRQHHSVHESLLASQYYVPKSEEHYQSNSWPDLVFYHPTHQEDPRVTIASSTQFRPVYTKTSNEKNISETYDASGQIETHLDNRFHTYTWSQCSNMVTLYFDSIRYGINQAQDFRFEISNKTHLTVWIKDQLILEGHVSHPLTSRLSKWIRVETIVQVLLVKENSNVFWKNVFVEHHPLQMEGEHVIEDEEQEYIAASVTESLKPYTSDTWIDLKNSSNAPNLLAPEQEECDEQHEDLYIQIVEPHCNSSKLLAGYDWMGGKNSNLECLDIHSRKSFLLVRNGIDAVVLSLAVQSSLDSLSDAILEEVCRFTALGYVMASKTNMKYIFLTQSLRFIVALDAEGTIFVYRQSISGQTVSYFTTCSIDAPPIGVNDGFDDEIVILTERNVYFLSLK